MNRLISIDGIREKSINSSNKMTDRKKEIWQKTNSTISKIFNREKQRSNNPHIGEKNLRRDNKFENHNVMYIFNKKLA